MLILAQNSVLNFKNRGVSVKEDVNIPARIVSNIQNYIELEYNFEEAFVVDIRRDADKFQLVKIKGFGFMDDLLKQLKSNI